MDELFDITLADKDDEWLCAHKVIMAAMYLLPIYGKKITFACENNVQKVILAALKDPSGVEVANHGL